MLASLLIKVKFYGAFIIAAVIAGLAAWAAGKREGKQTATAQADREAREVVQRATDIRTKVDQDVARLPPSAADPAGPAVPGSAAEQLRDKWSRD